MKSARAAPWRRLAPLGGIVLALHLALLQEAPRRVEPARAAPLQFAVRPVVAQVPAQEAQPAFAPPAASPSRSPLVAPAPAAAPSPAFRRPAPPARAPAPAAPRPPTRPAPALAAAAPAAAALAAPAPAAAAPAAAAPAQESTESPPLPTAPPPLPAVPAPSPPPAAAPPAAPQLALPPPVRLHYEVSVRKGFFTLQGRAVLDWRHDGQAYEARLEATSIAASRVQRSSGRITPQGLAPAYFSDKARSEQATHFDRERGRLVFSNNRPDAPLEPGMQDRLSVLLQLAALVAGAPANYPPGTQLAVPTASTREAESWVFVVEGEEDLALPGGAVRALKLQRMPRREYDQKVELWLAPRMAYAPVRLRLTNPNGDTVDNRWSSTDRG